MFGFDLKIILWFMFLVHDHIFLKSTQSNNMIWVFLHPSHPWCIVFRLQSVCRMRHSPRHSQTGAFHFSVQRPLPVDSVDGPQQVITATKSWCYCQICTCCSGELSLFILPCVQFWNRSEKSFRNCTVIRNLNHCY